MIWLQSHPVLELDIDHSWGRDAIRLLPIEVIPCQTREHLLLLQTDHTDIQ